MDNNREMQTNLYKTTTNSKFTEDFSMKKNNKNKANNKKRIVTSVLLVALALIMVLGVFMLAPTEASAATVTTSLYTTYGNYSYDGSTYSGYPSSYFKVTMSGASTSGTSTMYNDSLTCWTWYYIKVVDVDIRKHVSFKLYRNNVLYSSKTLEDDGDLTLFSGSLSDGEYRLEYVCNIGSWISNKDYTYTYRFEVDKTAPTATLKAGGSTISSGTYTNKQVVYSATDNNTVRIRVQSPSASSYATSYNSSYTVAATDANNGWWYVYALDSLDNSTSAKSFYMDTKVPTGKVTNTSGTTISNGGYAKTAIKYTASDTGSGVSSIQYKSPTSSSWASYTSGTSVSGTGWHTWRCYDRAGNVSVEYKVYCDQVAPTGTLYGGTTTKSSGSYTNASYVRYVASDTGSGIANCYVKMPGSSYFTTYASGTQLATEGKYEFYCVDKSSNQSSTVTIWLDKTAPTGTLYAGANTIQSGGSTNASYIRFVPSDNIGVSAIYVKKPGSTSYVSYTSGAQLSAEGTYTFYALDASQNSSVTYTVTINRQIPAAQLYADEKGVGSGTYTNAEYIKFVCAENSFVKLPGTTEFIEYISGTEFSKAGKYVFFGRDSANNSTGEYTIIIDRTEKSVTLDNVTEGHTDGDVKISWTNGNADTYAPIMSVTVNGKSVSNGTVIRTIDTAKYLVVVTDTAGNVWSTEFVSSKQNVQTSTLQKEYYEVADKDGNIFAFSSYEKALEFATARENALVVSGTWNSATWDVGIAIDEKSNAVNGTYFIYKKSGSPDEQVAYFTAERLAEVIAEYAEDSVKSYYYWQKAPATAADGENLYSYSAEKTILANKVEFGADVGLLLDGEDFVGNVIETEGRHTVTVFDEFGNTCDYTVIIIRNAPSVQYAIGEGSVNDVSFDRTYFFKDEVTVSITDELDEFAMFRIYRVVGEDETELVTIKSLGESFTLTESGTYTVVAVNHAGDSQTFNLVISRSAPSVTLTEDAENKQLVIEVKESADAESHIQTLVVQKSTDNGETWVTLETDDYGTPIELDTLTYKFRTSGIYKVTVTDEFRTGIDSIIGEKNYTQPAPTGELEGVKNGGHTNTDVTFSWDDDAIVTVTKNGEKIEYKSGAVLSEDADYTITFENHDGNKTVYTFTIDTVAPEIAVEGAKTDAPTNTSVSVNFDEEGLTAILEKDGTEVGAYVSGTVINEEGRFTVVVTDKAQNETKTSFVIDKSVSYDVNINNGGLANSVTVNVGEALDIVVTKDGTPIEYEAGEAITEPAAYTVTLTDEIGNKAEFGFTIVEPIVGKYEKEIDLIPDFEKVLVNGTEVTLEKGTLTLTESGVYEVSVVAGGKSYPFTVTVDATAPTLTLNGVENGGATTEAVTLTDVSEEAEVVVTLNGEAIEYTVGDELTEIGEYKVTVTDACGNATEYTFTIEKGANIALIVIIVILVLGGIGTGVFFYFKRKNSI